MEGVGGNQFNIQSKEDLNSASTQPMECGTNDNTSDTAHHQPNKKNWETIEPTVWNQ